MRTFSRSTLGVFSVLLAGAAVSPAGAADLGVITTPAGNGAAGFSGDGGPAASASFYNPVDVAVDGAGTVYVADASNNRVRKIAAGSGIVTTVAGNGSLAFGGDGGPATAASLWYPSAIALDSAGNLFIAEVNNDRVRRVDAQTGIITTVAGNGVNGFAGDGGPATSASLYYPYGVAVDSQGNLFIADLNNERVRRVDAATGTITTVAGNGTAGFSGDGGSATSAMLNMPAGLALDSAGNLFIADQGNGSIRRLDAVTGMITTVAGTGVPTVWPNFSPDGGLATATTLYYPTDVWVDSSGNLLIAEPGSNRIRRVDAGTGIMSTSAGNGSAGFSGDGGPATSAMLNSPNAVVADNAGDLFIADQMNNRIRQVTLQPASTTLITASLNPAQYGQTITFTASVSPTAATGTIQFFDGSSPLGTVAISGGTAALSVPSLSAGTHSITAAYSGDSTYFASTSAALTEVVGKATAGVALSSGSNPSPSGQAITFTMTTSPNAATGTVQLLDGATVIATVNAGTSTATITLSMGSHAIAASYGGDANFNAATSSVLTEIVTTTTTTSLSSDLNPSLVGQTVHLSAAVRPAPSSGTVQFFDGGASLGVAAISSGGAVLTISSLSVGGHSITGVYSGDGSVYLGSSSAAMVQTVNKNLSSVTLTSSADPSISGQSVTFYASISPGSATGTVQFLDGSSVLGSTALSSGLASLTASSLAAGTHAISAVYSGDGTFSGTSASVSQIVRQPTATSLATDKTSTVYGQTVTFTATVSPSAVTGIVQFLDGTVTIGSAPLSAGAAKLAITTLSAGSHSVTAVYSGDNIYATSTSAVRSVTVAQAKPGITLTGSPNPASVGQIVTFTAKVSAADATGTATFRLGGSTILGTVPFNAGVASLSTSALPKGSDSITATYSGDMNYKSVTSTAYNEKLN